MPELDYWKDEDSKSCLVSETSIGAMAKDTRVTFDSEPSGPPPKSSGKSRRATERQISYEDAENCVNEMSESFPALSNRAHRIMRQVSGSFNSKTIKVCLILSIILNLLLGIPFGVFLGMWLTQKNDFPMFSSSSSSSSSSSLSSSSSVASQSSSSSSLTGPSYGNPVILESCFSCSGIDPSFNDYVKIRSRNNICCTDVKLPDLDGSGYLILSDEYIKRKLEELEAILKGCRVHNGLGSGSTALDAKSAERLVPASAAHLYLDLEKTRSNALTSSQSKQTSALAWKTTDKYHLSFVRDGLRYEDGQIIVQKAGTYHVYSQMVLRRGPSQRKGGKPDYKTVVHSIMKRYNRSYPPASDETLLIAQLTVAEGEVKASNLAGSFELQEGDKLSVYVSFPSYLVETAAANVFGLFRL